MLLWTIQPYDVYQSILRTGKYQCDFSQCSMPEFQYHYDWLANQMQKRVGAPPPGVSYPVWAWHTYDGKHRRLDLRKIRWSHGSCGEKLTCLEILVPDKQVLLSDFDAWSIILLNGLISDSEDEDVRLNEQYEALSQNEQRTMKLSNWERAFDIRDVKNDWVTYGDNIQATFWELRVEQIKNVRCFTAAG